MEARSIDKQLECLRENLANINAAWEQELALQGKLLRVGLLYKDSSREAL